MCHYYLEYTALTANMNNILFYYMMFTTLVRARFTAKLLLGLFNILFGFLLLPRLYSYILPIKSYRLYG